MKLRICVSPNFWISVTNVFLNEFNLPVTFDLGNAKKLLFSITTCEVSYLVTTMVAARYYVNQLESCFILHIL